MDALPTNTMSSGPSSLYCPVCLGQVVSRPERKLDWVDCSWHSMYSVHHYCQDCGKDLGMFYLPKKAWVPGWSQAGRESLLLSKCNSESDLGKTQLISALPTRPGGKCSQKG